MEPVRSTSAAARRDQGGRWDVTAAESSGPQVVAQTAAEVGAPAARSRFGAYLGLTKPRIIELLLVTTVPTMFLAAGGFPPVWTMVATLVGGALAAGGANTLNSYIDRDIDAKMVRTGRRPLVTGEVSPRNALVFGWVLSVLSVLWLALTTNVLSAVLAAGAIFFYVVIYTLGLKRRTPQNIVWGGAAGCFPVLIGWSAVTGTVGWAALVLFGIIFFWTPPHYWPLSLRFQDDYAAAGVPMLPVVASQRRVAIEIIVYSWLMVITSLVLVPVAPMGWFYTAVAATLGVLFLYEAHALLFRVRKAAHGGPQKAADVKAMRLFHGSISYLALLFLAIAIDPFLH
ncbi:MAG: protoheme IX farnesyltransferase [Actinobacteria bacterium]|nr:MAG: protoheme IX farnesyltransferase [Actinomycetota bacterium]